ncbi:hypothetical protein MKX01_002030 [Papaver californicum]|nr:hypothetical protein MKX01_002030 [Papaver californicum]
MMSQSYDVHPSNQLITQLPHVELSFPMYIDGHLKTVPVLRPTDYLYDFSHITASRGELLSHCFEQHMFLDYTRTEVSRRSRGFYFRGISSYSSGFSSGTPQSHSARHNLQE